MSTRFNKETWAEHEAYCEKKGITGCIYGPGQMIQSRIPLHSLLFVVEMNNTLNRIEGIGLIRNTLCTDKYYKIYETGAFNCYTYRGKYRLDREQIKKYNPSILTILDHVLFKGKTHLKRLPGISLIPDKLMQHEMCEGLDLKKEIETAFVGEFKERIEDCGEKD